MSWNSPRRKSELRPSDLLIRGALAGALLGIATSFAFVAVSQGLPPLVGAAIFPVGFVILVLLCCWGSNWQLGILRFCP
jgi:formate/nitrite transporter FocA (FNT family)